MMVKFFAPKCLMYLVNTASGVTSKTPRHVIAIPRRGPVNHITFSSPCVVVVVVVVVVFVFMESPRDDFLDMTDASRVCLEPSVINSIRDDTLRSLVDDHIRRR